jgi:subfamily B ATP-binding cassette protein HlyB/CyaB
MSHPQDVPSGTVSPQRDTLLQSLLMMASFHGIAADEAQLRHEFGSEPFDRQTLLLACRHLGISARLVSQPRERLERAPLPAIAVGADRKLSHF